VVAKLFYMAAQSQAVKFRGTPVVKITEFPNTNSAFYTSQFEIIFANGKVHAEFLHFLCIKNQDIENIEVIIKDIQSYIYQYFKWSRDN